MNKALLVDVLESFRSRKGRTLLSAGLIVSGFLLLTFMLGIIQALEQQSKQTLNEFGADIALLNVAATTVPPYTKERLTLEFGKGNVSSISKHLIFVREARTNLSVTATDQHLFQLRPYVSLTGRGLDAIDIEQAERNCVISKSLSARHSLKVNDLIHLRNQAFTIVGLIQAFKDSDAQIYIPNSCKALWSYKQNAVTLDPKQFVIKSQRSSNKEITAKLKQQFADNESFQKKISITTADVLLQGVNALSTMVKITAGGIALICIFYGCLNLGTLMMANVRERVSEIGLRRALGANTFEISSLFMFEALGLCVSSALIATLVGNAAFIFIPQLLNIPMQTSFSTLAAPLLIALIAGSISAYYPAKIASAIRPANALRL